MWWMVVDAFLGKRLKFPLEVEISTVQIFVLSTLYPVPEYQWQSAIIQNFDWNINGNCWISENFRDVFVSKPALLKSTTYSHQKALVIHITTPTHHPPADLAALRQHSWGARYASLYSALDHQRSKLSGPNLKPWGVVVSWILGVVFKGLGHRFGTPLF